MKDNNGKTTRNRDYFALGRLLMTAFIAIIITAGGASVVVAQIEGMTKPEPTVPEMFTLQGEFVRMAYNYEGFVTLG